MTNEFIGVKIKKSNIKEIPMRKFLKKLIVISLLGGLILAIGKGGTNKVKPMNGIDPGPANIMVK